MGVTGLWTVLQPVARPVKLETLNRKRLAVDASIWIYQFLKAVRDKEGNALRNSHVVGFFRRICKLLFFGIKPVFVFDGGAPVLKRQTISARKARREGRREDAVRTAGKLLAVQMHRRAEEEEQKRRDDRAAAASTGLNAAARREREDEEAVPDEQLNYVSEQLMTPEERQQGRKFRKKDAYHLPELEMSLAEMGAPNDPRIMSQEELEEYARHFHEGEDINVYDFSKIDFDSPFFVSLPATDRYNILNAARLRSRLRMGYSKEQLDQMFPDRMAFSKFQIERVKERNDLTQRLMNINGMNPNDVGAGRIAGERGKEYVLVKNDGVEGGWALGVVSNKDEGKKEKPIDVDKPLPAPRLEADDSDESFEDVPVEGLNRLPKRPKPAAIDASAFQDAIYARPRRAVAPVAAAGKEVAMDDDDDGLFVPGEDESDIDEQFEDVPPPVEDAEEDEELQKAIQMSLQQDSDVDEEEIAAAQRAGEQARAQRLRKEKTLEFGSKGAAAGRAFASYANARAARVAPRAQAADETMNPELRAAFEAGRKMGHKRQDEAKPAAPAPAPEPPKESRALAQPSEFKGPLPFESLDLGKSLFSKKKKKEPTPEEEGGFQKEDEKEKPKPLPPWFAGDIDKQEFSHSHIQKALDAEDETDGQKKDNALLHAQKTGEVIDLDAEDEKSKEPIEIDASDEEETGEKEKEEEPTEHVAIDTDVRMDDIADKVRAEPPVSDIPNAANAKEPEETVTKPFSPKPDVYSPGEDSFEWEESDYEDRENLVRADDVATHEPQSSPEAEFEEVPIEPSKQKSPSPEPDFEDVEVPDAAEVPTTDALPEVAEEMLELPQEDDAFEQAPAEDFQFEDDFSDPEEEELLRQLGVEAEEHARFAAQLNVATGLQSAADYEKELKQLRNQQRADRRDADEVTTIMIQECQQLLRLFGLPYITAPMEAEAQCAELLSLGLVDGIVTDDSDIFLFGGSRVYKNMFNQAKFVECYLFNDLEREYGLTREKIIQIAHLLGSDYTDGVPGVGPVTALEIITEFGNVKAFQGWWDEVQTGLAPPDGKGFRKRFRRNAAKIFLPHGFPDPRVDQAYLQPEVDSDPSQFQWGVPDLESLREFLMSTIGWSPARTDEILVPVIRDMNRRDTEGTQANLTHFFGRAPAAVGASNGATTTATTTATTNNAGAGGEELREAYAPRRRKEGKSSRMENALERLHQQTKRRAQGRDPNQEESEAEAEEQGEQGAEEEVTADTTKAETKKTPAPKKAAPKKRKARPAASRNEATSEDNDDDDMDRDDSDEEAYEPPKKASRKRGASSRKQKA